MKRYVMMMIGVVMATWAAGQSVVIGAGANIDVGAGADICATAHGNITGSPMTGSGTQCGGTLPVELISFEIVMGAADHGPDGRMLHHTSPAADSLDANRVDRLQVEARDEARKADMRSWDGNPWLLEHHEALGPQMPEKLALKLLDMQCAFLSPLI